MRVVEPTIIETKLEFLREQAELFDGLVDFDESETGTATQLLEVVMFAWSTLEQIVLDHLLTDCDLLAALYNKALDSVQASGGYTDFQNAAFEEFKF